MAKEREYTTSPEIKGADDWAKRVKARKESKLMANENSGELRDEVLDQWLEWERREQGPVAERADAAPIGTCRFLLHGTMRHAQTLGCIKFEPLSDEDLREIERLPGS